MKTPSVSVVIATFDRAPSLVRLLVQLCDQTLARDRYEVIVVDDGSKLPVAERVEQLHLPLEVQVLRQENAGAATARHRGIAQARGKILVLVDDDMEVPRTFLAAHLAVHEASRTPVVVLGRMRAPGAVAGMPLHERWHQAKLDDLARQLETGATPRGNHLYTGNVSLPRAAYVAVGGFDTALGHSEDAELGLRLERAGCRFVFSPEAWSIHQSDHASLDGWLARARKYGRFDARIGRKHADTPHADPWRFFFDLNAVLRPALLGALTLPRAAEPFARLLMKVASAVDGAGAEPAALMATTAAFGIQYFGGLRDESRSTGAALAQLARHAAEHRVALTRISRRWLADVRADQATLRRYEGKYGHASPSSGKLAPDLAQKIGLQLLAGYRLMRALREAGQHGAAKVVSRLLRHAYGSDLHWEAELAPGVMIVHGMGLAISHAARVGPGCILFQHVTLGISADPLTGEVGAPTLERDVHVGPGATLLGPIRIGEGSKIMAGAVVTESVPPYSVVRVRPPEVTTRRARRTDAEPGDDGRAPEPNALMAASVIEQDAGSL